MLRIPENMSDWLCDDEIHSLEIGIGAGIIASKAALDDADKIISMRKAIIDQMMNDAIEESLRES